jgi:hypothetical protein
MSPSADPRREQLRSLYGFDFPDHFFRFWEFANRHRPLDPLRALSEPLGLALVGPFDVMAGRFDSCQPRLSALLHWRYYLDPPEFFTVLAGGGDGLHWGYYLDEPASGVGCVASYYANDVFEMSVDGDDLFQAVRLFLEEHWDCGELDHGYGLIAKDEHEAELASLSKFREKLLALDAGRPQTGAAYVDSYAGRCSRRRVVAETPEGLGVVAPPEAYRPPSLPDKKLRALLRKEADPRAVVVEARQALRDGFPATALKLGKELWPLHGRRKTEYAYELLDAAYAGLGRHVLRTVLRTHREHRDLPSVDIFDAETQSGNGEA